MSKIVSNGISDAVAQLQSGQLVAFPTETVYGLGADASNPIAVKAIYEMKGRPEWHPLIVHLSSAKQLGEWATEIPSYTTSLTDAFWPGPLTLVLPRKIDVLDAVTGGLDTVAIRVPSHPVAQELLIAFGSGIAAPSANKFGHVSATTAQHVFDEFPDDDILIIDGGPSEIGLESTIAQLNEDEIVLLRPGKISAEELADVSGVKVRPAEAGTSIAPGMLPSHYAPHARVILSNINNAAQACEQELESEHSVAFIGIEFPNGLPAEVNTLTQEAESESAFAQHLYDRLRLADKMKLDAVVIVPPEESSSALATAIWDRLRKASAAKN